MLIDAWITGIPIMLILVFSSVGWGLFLKRRWKVHSHIAIATGLGLHLSTLTLFGTFGFYILPFATLTVLWGLVEIWGGLIDWAQARQKPYITKPDWHWLFEDELFWLILPILYFIVRFFSAGLPQQHSDPLYYHLMGPLFWAEAGRIAITPEHPSFAQNGIWESLYGISFLWLGTTTFKAKLVGQLVAQWLHLIWGQVGSMILAAAILKRLVPELAKRGGLRFFLGWLCTTIASFEWTGTLAKNEYILLYFSLAAIVAMLEKRIFFAGLLAGFAFATKVLTLWLGVGLLVFVPFLPVREWKKRVPHWLVYIAGCVLGGLPYVFRNWWYTGNPVFPAFEGVFGPGWLSSYFTSHFSAGGGGLKFSWMMFPWFWEKAFERGLPKILFLGGFFAIGAWMWRAYNSRKKFINTMQELITETMIRWFLFALIQTTFVLLMFRTSTDGRYANYTAVCWLLLSVAIFYRGFEVFAHEQKPTVQKKMVLFSVPALLALGLLINIPVDLLVKVPRDYLFEDSEKYLKQFHLSQAAKDWLNQNVPSEKRVFFAGEKMNFYLNHSFEAVAEMKKWEEFFVPIQSADSLFEKLRAQGYEYLYLNADAEYPPPLRPYWRDLLGQKEKMVFKSSTAILYRF